MDRGVENELRVELRRTFPGRDDTLYEQALRAYLNARMDGLCHDGAWECAAEVLRRRK